MEVRKAQKENCRDLAFLINLAGEGIPAFLWEGMIEANESPLDVGAMRAAREEGGFSYTNARICVENGGVQGMVVAYRQPDSISVGDLSQFPGVVRPLIELEAQAPGSWYVNAIAVYEDFRGKGIARKLMECSEEQARSEGCDSMSLIVASENSNAKKLYEYLGFISNASLPVISYPGCLHGGDWVLMTKDLRNA